MAEAGYPNGFDMDLYFPPRSPERDITPKIQADLAEAGIRAKVSSILPAEALSRRQGQKLTAYVHGWGGALAHAENYVGAWADYDRKTQAFWFGFNDAKAKELVAKTAFAPTDEEAKRLYNELTEYMFEKSPYVNLFLVYRHIPAREWVRRLRVKSLYLHTTFDTASKQKID